MAQHDFGDAEISTQTPPPFSLRPPSPPLIIATVAFYSIYRRKVADYAVLKRGVRDNDTT